MSVSVLPQRLPVAIARLCLLTSVFAVSAQAQSNYATPHYFSTFAGTGTESSADGTGTAAGFNAPSSLVIDDDGNLFVADRASHTIRKVTPTGVVTTIAGQAGSGGSIDATGTAARFNAPTGLARDNNDNLYVADTFNQTIRKITPQGTVTTIAGQPGIAGSTDGTGSAARFRFPSGVAIDRDGNLYVADTNNHVIRKVTPAGVVTTAAGLAGSLGSVDGPVSVARFRSPMGALIYAGVLYVSEAGNRTIRKIIPGGTVTTLAGLAQTAGTADGTGAAARFSAPNQMAVDDRGEILVADGTNHLIRKVSSTGEVTTIAGLAGVAGSTDGLGNQARFNNPFGIAIDDAGTIHVADTANHRIRRSIRPPSLIVQVPSPFVNVGGAVEFRFRFSTLNANTVYQWLKNGVSIFGESGSAIANSGDVSVTKSFANMQLTDAGTYAIAVTNIAGTTTSTGMPITVVAPPVITRQPSDQTATAGVTVQFSATVASNGPTSFQWRKNFVAIPGATTNPFAIASPVLADAGTYSLVVTNNAGTATSDNATLTVNVPPTITSQPTNQTAFVGASVQFNVSTTPASGPTFQWRRNGLPIPGATNAQFSIPVVALTDAGNYSVVITNTGISLTSNNATLVVNVPVSTQPITHTTNVGAPVQFNVTGTPAPGTTFQWRKDGVPLSGATSALFTINSATLADAGDYTVIITTNGVSQTSNTATLIVVPVSVPTITTQPANSAVVVGMPAQFSVVATSPVPATFQWRKNGSAIPGATNEIYAFASVTIADAATYSVAISNAGGTTISNNATLTVNAPVGIAPAIATHPADQTANVGATLSFSVSASGTPPLSFQWFKNGTAIVGATTPLFSIPNVQPADAASYAAIVTNSAGTATSNPAVLQVFIPPLIATQPVSTSIIAGTNVGFSVGASGTAPMTYQWRRDGVPLPGATNATLALTPARLADAGGYSVVVSNAAGAVTSGVATLNVAPAGPSSQLSNVSIRTTVASGQIVIVGMAVAGGSRDVLVRAIGPSLSVFGISSAMVDPRLELFRGENLILTNEDWAAALAPTFASAGAFALTDGSRDAAFVPSVNGSFSIQGRGTGGGALLVETYALGAPGVGRLVNISARNRAGTGDDILIAGFTVTGTGTKQLLIRGIGPGLVAFGVPETLVDPRLDVFTADGSRLTENDDWSASLASTFAAVGAFALPPGSRDAAVLITLSPGSYTAQVRGADNGTGEALVEIYEVP